MHTTAYVFRRKPGMSLDDFLAYYEHRHGPLMASLMKPCGLISYEQHPVRPLENPGDGYVPVDGPAYDAISIYTFESGDGAQRAWDLPEVIADSQNFIDFESMQTLPISRRKVL
jgi:hypothetical protein